MQQKPKSVKAKESEMRFKLIFENSPVGKSITGIDGSIKVNKAFCKILGYSKKELLVRKWKDITHPDDIQASQEVVDKILKGQKKSVHYEKRYIHKTGRTVNADVSTTLQRDDSGKPLYFITIIIDITEQKKVELALREAKRNLEKTVNERTFELKDATQYNRSLIEASLDPFVTIGKDGRITDVNEATVKITGYSRKSLIGTNFSRYFVDTDSAAWGYQKVFKQGTVRNYPLDLKHKRGKVTPVQYNASVYRNIKGEVEGVFAAARDMTEKRNTEEELRKSKKLLDETGRLARVGGWEIDLKTNTLSWSDMTYDIHEIDHSFIPNLETGINFYAPEAIPVISRCVERAINLGEPFDEELELITANKNRIWVRAIGEAYRENSEIVKISGVFQDINARKLIQDELKKHHDHLEELVKERTVELDNAIADLKRSNMELEQFAYVASHDLQEPLRMVSSYTQLLEKRYKDQLDQDAKDFIFFAVDGANRMQHLINDLLEYSRITTKGKAFNKLDLTHALGQAIANLQRRIQETGSMVVNEDLPFVFGDEMQLVRVFQNLIENAIKFRGPDPPRITIKSQMLDGKVRISVSDNGIGIEKIYSERVFAIFQRLHSKTEYPGTGIGLAICKRIIERHNGKIWLESVPGEGTTFYFTLNSN
jgi:PAS domain S-box-containing protein